MFVHDTHRVDRGKACLAAECTLAPLWSISGKYQRFTALDSGRVIIARFPSSQGTLSRTQT
jgi:hypothetical protein